ncbi:MAG: hypothetical protein JY451_04355 [Erythrobacter sp.]|nr:MAG: hypothetical protein JY451_04355 [Erythrobacter sp.]
MIAAYILSCLLLVLAFQGLHVWPRTKAMTRELRGAFAVMTDKALSDDHKEAALRRRSIEVLGLTVRLTLVLIATFAAAALPVVLAQWAGWLTWQDFLVFSIQPLVVVATVAALALWPLLQSRLARS